MTRHGLQKHLLFVHQQVFIGFTDRTRTLTSSELDTAMQKHGRGQYHERSSTVTQPAASAGRPSSILRVRITKPVRVAPIPAVTISRLVAADSAEIRRIDTPPMPILFPVNDLGAAQLDYPPPDALSVHSSDINLSLLDKTLSKPASSAASVSPPVMLTRPGPTRPRPRPRPARPRPRLRPGPTRPRPMPRPGSTRPRPGSKIATSGPCAII